MKRPLLTVALLYVAGVSVADYFDLPLIGLMLGCLLLALTSLLWTPARPWLLCILLVASGATNLKLHTAIVSPHDLRLIIANRIENVTFRGGICQLPLRRDYARAGDRFWRTTAELAVDAVRLDVAGSEWRPAFGRITVSTPGNLGLEYRAGQKVEVAGQVHAPKDPVAQGLFDYPNHLRRLGIYYQLNAESTNAWKLILPTNSVSFTERFVAWGKAALASGLPVEDESLRLEWALTLGWKPALTEDVSEPFIRAATYHIFAVDGLRIAIICAIFLNLFRVVGLSRATGGMLVIPLVWLYAAMTGFPASAIRAAVMASVVICGRVLKRPSDFINSLFAAALIILVCDPAQLFQAGFQLSFCVVFCILLLMPAFEAFGQWLFKPEPWLPTDLQPRWRRIVATPAHYIGEVFLVSMAAWLGSIPLSALYFNILTPVSGPANLLAVPLCGLVLICNLISLLLTSCFPWAAEIYNHAGWFCMECIRVTSEWFTHWPAAYYYVAAPALGSIVLYYLLLLTLGTGWVFKFKYRGWALSGLALLTTIWFVDWGIQSRTTRLTVVPLKGASATFVDAPGNRDDLLIDCGNETSASSILKPFLQAQGVNHLPRLLLTHGELASMGGAEVMRKDFTITEVDVSAVRFRSVPYRRVLQNLGATPGLLKVIARSNYVGSWLALHPAAEDHFSQADDNSMVLFSEINGTKVLLLSALGRPGQNALFTRHPDLRADIVVAGLPQHSDPIAEAVLDALQPRLIIIADSEYPASARANRTLRERLAHRNSRVVYTSESGAVTILFHRTDWEVKARNPGANTLNLAMSKLDELPERPHSAPEE